MNTPSPAKTWRVSPLMKFRMCFGLQWILALGLLFIFSIALGAVKVTRVASIDTPFWVVFVLFGLVELGLIAYGAFRGWVEIGILEHAKPAEGRIDDVTESKVRDDVNSSVTYTLHMTVTDEGQTWEAWYSAGIKGEDAAPGDSVDVLYDARNPQLVLPIQYMNTLPRLGEDGVIRPASNGESYGFIAVAVFVVASFIAAMLI